MQMWFDVKWDQRGLVWNGIIRGKWNTLRQVVHFFGLGWRVRVGVSTKWFLALASCRGGASSVAAASIGIVVTTIGLLCLWGLHSPFGIRCCDGAM